MEYIKLFTDMLDDHFDELTDAEVGEIVRCALRYARDGEEPDFERRSVLGLTWKRFKAHVDQSVAKAETLRANGSKPKQTEANRSKPKQSEASRSKEKHPEATASKTPYDHKHNQEQEQEHKQEQEQEQIDARAPASESVIAIDGNDIREDIERNQIADELILSYRLGRDDRTREALLHDLAEHGEARMREVLDKAADGNTREKISVNFWRAILADKSRASPKGYQQRAHDQSYWDSIEVKFDANGEPIV